MRQNLNIPRKSFTVTAEKEGQTVWAMQVEARSAILAIGQVAKRWQDRGAFSALHLGESSYTEDGITYRAEA